MSTSIYRKGVEPERTEVVKILMVLEKAAYDRHTSSIFTLMPEYKDRMVVDNGDLINITYTFTIDYHHVVKGLHAVADICDDPDVIVSVDCKELEEERLLVYETLKKLDAVIQAVKERDVNKQTDSDDGPPSVG
jgi:hypothetical protein